MAARGEQGISLSHEQQRLHAARAEPEAHAHGPRCAGGALLYERARHGGLPAGAGTRLLGVCHRRGGTAQRPLRRGHHDERCEPRLCGRGRGAQLFARYAHKGDEPCDAGREAHRRELRCVRPHRKRHRARLPRTHRAHRDGDGQAGVFLRQAESADDADRAEKAELPLR